jgi:photosystem II stability/assembly factor-like uncharacterized protein
VCFTKQFDGWLATQDAVYRSTDGGVTWTPSYFLPVTGDGIAVLECADGGAAWVQFAPIGAAGGAANFVLVATRNGESWATIFRSNLYTDHIAGPNGPGSYPGPFSLIDASTAYAVGNTPVEPAVTGQQVTDLTQLGPVTKVGADLNAIGVSFADRDHGVIVGSPSVGGAPVYITDDGGTTWRSVTP